ncbi:MAG: hypothetical protein ACI89P_000878, partial [Colwellia sp.]
TTANLLIFIRTLVTISSLLIDLQAGFILAVILVFISLEIMNKIKN